MTKPQYTMEDSFGMLAVHLYNAACHISQAAMHVSDARGANVCRSSLIQIEGSIMLAQYDLDRAMSLIQKVRGSNTEGGP